jgi:hypothetical protein
MTVGFICFRSTSVEMLTGAWDTREVNYRDRAITLYLSDRVVIGRHQMEELSVAMRM